MLLFTVNYSADYGYLYEFKAEAWEVKPDNYIQTNQTTVYVDVYMRRNKLSSQSAYNGYGTEWGITIDGDTKTGTTKWDTRNSVDWIWLGQHSKTITHNSDGSKEIYISAYHIGNSATGSSKMGNASGGANFTLTKIPRASKISATDADVGSISSIYIEKADNSFTHTITYSLGSKSGTVATKTQQSPFSFTVPTSLYSEIPGTEGTVTLKCITYSGDTVVGESTTTFKARVNQEDNKPTVSGTLVDSNSNTLALTGGSSTNVILVKNRSTAKITPTATGKNSASIKQITVEGTKVEGSYIEFKNTTKTSFNIVATDSRGFPNSKTLTPNKIIEYIPLTLTAKFYRTAATSSEVKLDYEGNFFNASFGAKTNKLTLKWEYKEKGATAYIAGGTLTPSISNNKYSGSVSLGTTFDYKKSYDFIIYANDGDGANIKLTSLNYAQNITRGEPIYDYGVDKNGENYLNVNGGLYIKNKSILNSIYPIGAIYMSVNNVNPGTIFGGTWTQIKDTFLLAAGNTYTAGSTGGKAKVNLSVENLPSHTHTGKTHVDGAHVHDSTAYGWMIDGIGNARAAVAEGSSGFGADIRIRNSNSEHQHWFTTDATGSGTDIENMPPYLTVYVWKRTA